MHNLFSGDEDIGRKFSCHQFQKFGCMVVFNMLTKIFSPIFGQKSDFKLRFGLLEVDSFSAKLSKMALYVLENHGPRSQNRKFFHVLERFRGSAMHQKNRHASRILLICVISACSRVLSLFFSKNRHVQISPISAGVRRKPKIAHESL